MDNAVGGQNKPAWEPGQVRHHVTLTASAGRIALVHLDNLFR